MPRRHAIYVVIRDLESDALFDVLRILNRSGIGLAGHTFDHEDLNEAWWNDSDYVGAEIIPDDVLALDENNAFDPVLPPPCMGRVAINRPIRIVEMPSGHMCIAKNDILVSEWMLAFLRDHCEVETGPVLIRDQRLLDWHRLHIRPRLPVMVEECLERLPCQACGTLGLFTSGVLLGRRIGKLVVCESELGLDHGQIFHPVILSTDVVRTLTKRRRKGYGLTPIVDSCSTIGKRVLQLSQLLQRLPHVPIS